MNIRKIRSIADELLEAGKYEDAFYIYDEIYSQIWGAIATIQSGLNGFSQNYLGSSFKLNYEFKNDFTLHASETVFKKWFDLDCDQTLNEFTFTTYGHLQCIAYSPFLNKTISADSVYSEFLILQTLVAEGDKDDWVNYILRIVTPMTEDSRIKKIRPNLTDSLVKKRIIETAPKLKVTDWQNINVCFLDYLLNMGDNCSDLYYSVHHIVGSGYKRKAQYKKSYKEKDETHRSKTGHNYKSYERYEKYERYERYENSASYSREFDPITATEFEKSVYYGKVLGLTGRISKTSVRKKYLELIAKYHPDKVFELGDELKILAEIKTKQINQAYDWMKKKYNI